MSDTTADRTPHATEPEPRISGQLDPTDPPASSGTEPSGTFAAPPPKPTNPLVSQADEDEEEDFFIPRGQSVQTAASGGKKGGRPR